MESHEALGVHTEGNLQRKDSGKNSNTNSELPSEDIGHGLVSVVPASTEGLAIKSEPFSNSDPDCEMTLKDSLKISSMRSIGEDESHSDRDNTMQFHDYSSSALGTVAQRTVASSFSIPPTIVSEVANSLDEMLRCLTSFSLESMPAIVRPDNLILGKWMQHCLKLFQGRAHSHFCKLQSPCGEIQRYI